MRIIKLNIGTAIDGVDKALPIEQIVENLIVVFNPIVVSLKLARSTTEETAVVELVTDVPASKGTVNLLCILLRQEAIAGRDNGTGFLYGPQAAKWGEFNPEFFIE